MNDSIPMRKGQGEDNITTMAWFRDMSVNGERKKGTRPSIEETFLSLHFSTISPVYNLMSW